MSLFLTADKLRVHLTLYISTDWLRSHEFDNLEEVKHRLITNLLALTGVEPVCQKLSMQVETYQVKVKPQKKDKTAAKGINRIKSLFSTVNARNRVR